MVSLLFKIVGLHFIVTQLTQQKANRCTEEIKRWNIIEILFRIYKEPGSSKIQTLLF
jgi:hypothetical protein